MKRLSAIILSLLLLLGMLSGCGATSKSDESMALSVPGATNAYGNGVSTDSVEVEEVEILDGDTAGFTTGSSSTSLPTDQKLIRTVYMDAETLSMNNLLSWLDSRISELGGYYEEKALRRMGSRDDGSYYQYADLMIRIPAENLDSFVSQIGEEANVTSTSETTENVTLTYVSTQSRVEALETEQKRLLELLENAETMEDLLVIEERLTDVRWELENYASQLRVLDNQVTYCTIYMNVYEVDEPTILTERTVWQKIGDGFTENAGDMWDGLVDFFIWALTAIPYLVPLSLIAAAVWLLIRLAKKLKFPRRKKKKPADTEKS